MDTKEKVLTLVEMGFTVDEAVSLAKGNYRTVPDPKQEPGNDPKQEQGNDPKQNKPWEQIEQALAKLTQSVINSNINNKQQPAPQTAQDVLGLMLEPAKPAERSN